MVRVVRRPARGPLPVAFVLRLPPTPATESHRSELMSEIAGSIEQQDQQSEGRGEESPLTGREITSHEGSSKERSPARPYAGLSRALPWNQKKNNAPTAANMEIFISASAR